MLNNDNDKYILDWIPMILITSGSLFFIVRSVISNIELVRRIRSSNVFFRQRMEKVQFATSNLRGYNYLRDVRKMIQSFRDELVSYGCDIQVLSVLNIYDKTGYQTMEFTETLIGKSRANCSNEPVRLFLLHASQYLTKKDLKLFLEKIFTFQHDTIRVLDTMDTKADILYRMMANRIATFSPNKNGIDLKVVPVILCPHIDGDVMKALECESSVSYVTTSNKGGFSAVLKNI